MFIYTNTCLKTLADKFIEDLISKDNFSPSSARGGFLTGGSVIVCEFRGLQEYLQKACVDKYGIWTAIPFKPLAGLLMQCAFNLSPKDQRKDENDNVYNQHNLVWAVYRLLEDEKKTFFFASELASLFFAYQIYRPQLIEAWDNNKPYIIKNADANFKKNEEFQRKLWFRIKNEYKNEQNIFQLYKNIENTLKKGKFDKKVLPKNIFIFAPLSIAPVHLSTLTYLSEAGSKVNLYLHQISEEYVGTSISDKKIAKLRKKTWENGKIINISELLPEFDENELYWDLGNRLIANLGRSSQVLYEQIQALGSLIQEEQIDPMNQVSDDKNETLLSRIRKDIIKDEKEKSELKKDDSVSLISCFSPLREVEVLCDYILDLFVKNKNLTPADIAVVSPNIDSYANAIETVFGSRGIPFMIADREVKKSNKTAQLLDLLFTVIGSRYEAPDIVALFEYSMYVQGKELDTNDSERLNKWVTENAIRHGLYNSGDAPNYSFEKGFDQLAAGFFMISETGFSAVNDYCYPDIEGNSAGILGDFFCFTRALQNFDKERGKAKSVEEWDYFLRENLQVFFGTDETDFNEDEDNPYQEIIGAWDSLKKEMLTGFGNNADTPIDFSVLKTALPAKLDANAKSSYSLSGRISFSNPETVRAVPHKVICCIGMNGREFPRQIMTREMSLMSVYAPGDKDAANEDRLMFLETICSAKEKLYISWVGRDEKTADELEPSSVVVMFIRNLMEQYGIEEDDLVTEHPLQPFSAKYFNGTLQTYDNRWNNTGNSANGNSDVWKWEIDNADIEKKRDVTTLFRILNDAPKYFLKDICNINLPEDAVLLENMEPFIVDGALEQWQLVYTILNSEDYIHDIKILKFRGELPSGKFADKFMEKIIKQTNEKRKLIDSKVKTLFIIPSKDQGKYRLKHWLYHLEYNLTMEEETDMIMLPLSEREVNKRIRLPGLSKENAENEIEKLWALADALRARMRPIFPNAAWEYIMSGNIEDAEESFFGDDYYSQYTGIIMGNAWTFKDLGIEGEFIECSKGLFENYNGCEYEEP
uniref:Exodeoxyribonuclease V gamma chain n=1 Tax=uncultured bacterium contig00021 TaxID=1181511 RepID=A0A806KL32_9BACT|nr:exodeoxyribonuclease V gamma chain [uncultured bacterium contig00021]